MRTEKIHFTNKSFYAVVEGKGDGLIICTPAVYESELCCGIRVSYEDGGNSTWGLLQPRDLIASWRATEILRRNALIENETLCSAYYMGRRNPSKFEMESHIEPAIKKTVGQWLYDRIMKMPVPEQIIRAILDNQGEDFHPDLCPITDEVRAGTIQWRQEFADAGIIHPNEVDSKKRSDRETIARFEPLLTSYAKSRDLKRHCLSMNYVESALLTLVDEGAHQTNSDAVLVALAGVVSEIAISAISTGLAHYSKKEYESQADDTMDKAISQSAKWLVSSSKRFLFFWKNDSESFTKKTASIRLQKMFEEYFCEKSETALS